MLGDRGVRYRLCTWSIQCRLRHIPRLAQQQEVRTREPRAFVVPLTNDRQVQGYEQQEDRPQKPGSIAHRLFIPYSPKIWNAFTRFAGSIQSRLSDDRRQTTDDEQQAIAPVICRPSSN